MSEPSSAPPDPAAVVCMGCDYDLRGLPRSANCPECGLPVARSGRANQWLWHAPPRWLASLSRGAVLVLAAVAVTALLPFAPGAWLGGVPVEAFLTAVCGVLVAAAALYASGVWLLTRPQARFAPAGGVVRLAARCAAFLPLLSELGAFVPRRPGILQWLRGATLLVWLVAAALLLLHLHRLALRLPEAALARACAGGAAALFAAGVIRAADGVLPLAPAAGLGIAGAATAFLGCIAFLFSMTMCGVAFRGAHRTSVREWHSPS